MTQGRNGGSHCRTDSATDQRSLATTIQAADNGASSSGLCDCGGGFPCIAVAFNGPLFVLHFGFIDIWRALDGAGQQYGVTARIDERGEVHKHFGASL